MNNKQIFRQIRADCFRFSRWNHLFSFLADFLGVVSPTLLSWLIGDMADYLLRLDTAAIGRQLPYFLLAMALAVVVAPLADLGENLRLTRDGFAYDNFLMERMLRLPVSRLQTLEKGTAIERLTNDSPALMYNQLMLHTRPLVLLGYGGVIAYLFTQNQTHILYFLAVFGVSSLPVFRAVQIGKRRAAMKGQTAQYTEARRTLEQELLAAKELSWGFPFPQLLTGRIRNCHHRYMETTGKAQCRLNALEAMLDFLCNHGAQIVTALFGAVLVSRHMLTFGAMLGGLLMQPTLARCCKMIYRFIGEVHDEKQYLERMAFLYGETEDEGEAPQGHLRGVTLRNVSYTYPGQSQPAVIRENLPVRPGQAVQLAGANGSGKSTILSILGGLYIPDSGEMVDESGRPVSPRQLCRRVALCRQSGGIFSGTVAENLFLPQDRLPAAAKLLGAMGFEKPLSYVVEPGGENLSYGEQKKILLVRALCKQADILALDEPLNHLDGQGRAALEGVLARYDGPVVYASHTRLAVPGHGYACVHLEGGQGQPD